MSRVSSSAMCLFKGQYTTLGALTAKGCKTVSRIGPHYAATIAEHKRQAALGTPVCAWCESEDTAREGVNRRCRKCKRLSSVTVEMESIVGISSQKVPVVYTQRIEEDTDAQE